MAADRPAGGMRGLIAGLDAHGHRAARWSAVCGPVGIIGFGYLGGWGPAISLVATESASVLSSVDLAVIPLFLIMGRFAGVSGLTSDIYRIAYALVSVISAMNLAPLAVILVLVFLILGSVFDTVAAMLITMPFIYPLVLDLGYSPIWWGVVPVMLIEVGMITPPIGMNVFVLYGVAGNTPLRTIFRGILPFFCADLIRILIVILFPVLTLWLPGLLGYKLG